jgi:hypothetical protein
MYLPENRLKWDKGVKAICAYKNCEYNFKTNDKCYIIHTQFLSPFKMIMSERDMLDKRIEFIDKEICYDYTSSIDVEVLKK